MKRPTDRRTVLLTAGVAAVAAAVGPVAAQPTDIRGAVTFQGGTVIPKGCLEIYLEDTAIQDNARRRVAKTRVKSDGRIKTIAFSLSPPASVDCFADAADRCAPRACGWLAGRARQRTVGGGFAGLCHTQCGDVLKHEANG